MKRSAAALSLAGNSLDESLALVTGANESVQNPESVGVWAKTLTMYLRAAKAEAEEAGIETDGMASSVSKLRESILSLTDNRVDIMADDRNYKSTIQIMREIASVYDSMADIDQAALLELLSGKRQANTTAALISNWSTVEDVIQSSMNSTGSATEENEKYLDSIEGKMSQFTAKFQALSSEVLDSELVKFTFDAGTGFLGFLSGIIEKLGVLKGIAVPAIATLAAFTNKGFIRTQLDDSTLSGTKIQWPTEIFSDMPEYFSISKQIDNDRASLSQFIEELRKIDSTDIQNAFSNLSDDRIQEIFKDSSDECRDFGVELGKTASGYEKAEIQCARFADTQRSNIFTTNAFAKAARSAAAGLKTIAVAAMQAFVLSAVFAIIQKGISVLDGLIMSSEEAAEVTQNAVSEFENSTSKIDGNIKSVESLRGRYEELSRGVNELGENVALSAEEYAEYKNIVQQIIDITPGVIQGYNAEGDAIVAKNGLIQESIDLLRQERIEKAKSTVYGTSDNDGGKSNLEAAVIDFNSNYQKKTSEAQKTAQNFANSIQAAYDTVLKTDPDRAAEFQKVIEKYAGATVSSIKKVQEVQNYAGGTVQISQTASVLDLTSQKSAELAKHSSELTGELERLGFMSAEASAQAGTLGSAYDVAAQEIEQSASNTKTMMQSILASNEDFYEIDGNMQSFLENLISSMDAESVKVISSKGDAAIVSHVTDMLNAVSDNPDVQNALNNLYAFDADTSNVTMQDYSAKRNSLVKQITSAFSDTPIDAEAVINVLPEANIDSEAMMQEIRNKVKDPEVLSEIQTLTMDEQIQIYYALTDVGNMSLSEFRKWLAQTRKEAAKKIEVKFTIENIQDDLADLGGSFDELDKIFKNFSDNKTIDTDALSSLLSKFGDVESVDIEGYVNAITKAGVTTSTLKTETDKLITSILHENEAFKSVNEATADNVAAMLESRGITNARALVSAQLKANLDAQTLAEYEAEKGALAFGAAESMNVGALISVAKQLGVTKAALFQYVLQKINSNAIAISTDGDISNVMALANACGIGIEAVSAFANAKKAISIYQGKQKIADEKGYSALSNRYQNAIDKYTAEADAALEKINTDFSNLKTKSAGGIKYNGGSGTAKNSGGGGGSGGSGGGSSGKSAEDQYTDWVKEQLEIMQHQIDVWEKNGGADKFGDQMIAQYQKMQDFVHKAANKYRNLGLSENSEEIREMQKKWLKYRDAVRDVYKSIYDTQKKAAEDSISILEKQYDQMEQRIGISMSVFRDAVESSEVSIPVVIDDEALDGVYNDMLRNIEERIKLQQEIMAKSHAEANRYRQMGYKDTSAEIREMQQAYLEAQNAITELKQTAAENLLGRFDEFIELADQFNRWDNLKTTKLDVLKRKLSQINKALADGLITLSQYKELYTETAGNIYDIQKDALDYIIDLTKEMIKQQKEEEIEALEKQNDLYQEKVDLIKESLSLTSDEYKHNSEVEKRLREIAKIQSKIDQLSLDDSREATAKRAELAEQLAELQQELAELQYDRGVEIQEDALDKQSENFEKANDEKIEALEKELSSEEKLYQAAIKYIDENWATLQEQLLKYNYEYGNALQSEVVDKWEIAKQAVERYGQSVKDAMQGIESENMQTGSKTGAVRSILSEMIANANKWAASSSPEERKALAARNDEISKKLSDYGIDARKDDATGIWYIGNSQDKLFDLLTNSSLMEKYFGKTEKPDDEPSSGGTSSGSGSTGKVAKFHDEILSDIRAMERNSSQWPTADKATRQRLQQKNNALRDSIVSKGLPVSYDSDSGSWHIGSRSGPLLYDALRDDSLIDRYARYHTGGIAGSLKPNELVAVLERGERIYTEEQNQKLLRIIEMQQKLAKLIPNGKLPQAVMESPKFSPVGNLTQRSVSTDINFAPEINIQIDSRNSDDGALVKRVRDSVLDAVRTAFNDSGIGSPRALRPI